MAVRQRYCKVDTAGSIPEALESILKEYEIELEHQILTIANNVAGEGKEYIKTKTPKRKLRKPRKGGHYINSYAIVRQRLSSYQHLVSLKNKQYQLSHLLERNHEIRNQYEKTRGHTVKNVVPFWKLTDEKMQKEYIDRIINLLK